MKCPYCGTENMEGTNLCVRCAGQLSGATQASIPPAQQPASQSLIERSPMFVAIVIIVAVLVIGSVIVAAIVLGRNQIQGPNLEITSTDHSATSNAVVFTITVRNSGTEAGSGTITCTVNAQTAQQSVMHYYKSQAVSLASGEEHTYTISVTIPSYYFLPGHTVTWSERLD